MLFKSFNSINNIKNVSQTNYISGTIITGTSQLNNNVSLLSEVKIYTHTLVETFTRVGI
ncbi:hypothetical protein DDB_G0281615 [Dictyostelium discoideum AX4]|uniref:Uncharacterized protein n=1 Tax=Dictyostelium discoideum TaxID=44689 RepID=Q54TQ5_DICDI|nr:hypothetical protein DDB_G0281615 [Dictyostelium discoideum AX4]EAL66569.1 hypothetical protein DDB_G0281615 [Dictyostelium discoideum AX4]|eukprot:XP_640536.1 hypothetical protein DDB_G0281615 [Dictyostelium discoideum AX4]